mmetsp:Transcript_18689/g.52774  ORF Transcript_18689/g.52774 Transcript_18689/m.52774 type:complete len:97 (-) Transcript_18689:211-501(-)
MIQSQNMMRSCDVRRKKEKWVVEYYISSTYERSFLLSLKLFFVFRLAAVHSLSRQFIGQAHHSSEQSGFFGSLLIMLGKLFRSSELLILAGSSSRR